MSSKNIVSIQNLFVFNSSFCEHEDEEYKKICCFYPDNTDLNTKIQCVGLCEAVIKFTGTFGSSACESLHTQKTKQIFLEPEPEFWMVMTLNVPNQQKTKDGQSYIEYYPDEIQDHVYQSLLLKCYRMFSLMNGTFHSFLSNKENGITMLKRSLSSFFDSYLSSIKSNDADLLDIFQGIHFLPLERYSFLKILCFINQVEEQFSCIKHSVFLYNDQLVWFMTGPKSPEDIEGLNSIPKIYLNSSKSTYYLIAYRALNATCCLLVDENTKMDIDLFKTLDAKIGCELSSLASEIGDQYSKTITHINNDQQAKCMYMYFNHMNLAEKTTMHSEMKRNGHSLIPSDIMKLFADIYADLSRMNDFGEIIGKTFSDCWIVGKVSDERELYVVLQQKNANIVDVNDELKKLSASHFQSIFIID